MGHYEHERGVYGRGRYPSDFGGEVSTLDASPVGEVLLFLSFVSCQLFDLLAFAWSLVRQVVAYRGGYVRCEALGVRRDRIFAELLREAQGHQVAPLKTDAGPCIA